MSFSKEIKATSVEEIIRERIELLYREIFFAKEQYFVFNDMCMNRNEEQYQTYNVCIMDALENSILMKLAKIYDNDINNDSITFYYVLNSIQSNKELNKNDKQIIKFAQDNLEKIEHMNAIDRLKKIRDKNIAHLDKKYSNGIKSINEKEEFHYNDFKILIDFAFDLILKIFFLVYKAPLPETFRFKILETEYNTIKKLQETCETK